MVSIVKNLLLGNEGAGEKWVLQELSRKNPGFRVDSELRVTQPGDVAAGWRGCGGAGGAGPHPLIQAAGSPPDELRRPLCYRNGSSWK